MDRFINNRAPKRILLSALLLFLLAAAGGIFLSELLADAVMSRQIAAMLAVQGGGSFTAVPTADAIAAGEASVSGYGIHADMEPSLMAGYDSLRTSIYLLLLAAAGIFCIAGAVCPLWEIDRTHRQLEALRSDCYAIAEGQQPRAALQGEDFGSVRRTCEAVNLMAARMQYLSDVLRNEKEFLKDFLTDFSHQIKTSLAVVRLNSDMIAQMEQLPEDKKHQLSGEITLHLDSMEHLVLTALQAARLNADAVSYEMEEADLTETCAGAVRRLMPLMRDKGIVIDMESPCPVLYRHDRAWLREAVCNLLKNAADHAACSRIVLELEEIPGAVKLRITDDGKGIPQSEIPYLFDRFARKSSSVSVQRAGVGLAIAKEIVKAHNGDISVYSALQQGTCFELLFLR